MDFSIGLADCLSVILMVTIGVFSRFKLVIHLFVGDSLHLKPLRLPWGLKSCKCLQTGVYPIFIQCGGWLLPIFSTLLAIRLMSVTDTVWWSGRCRCMVSDYQALYESPWINIDDHFTVWMETQDVDGDGYGSLTLNTSAFKHDNSGFNLQFAMHIALRTIMIGWVWVYYQIYPYALPASN